MTEKIKKNIIRIFSNFFFWKYLILFRSYIFQLNPYSTFEIPLETVINNYLKKNKKISVAEFGTGKTSAKIFLKLSKKYKNNFTLYSYENNKLWFNKIAMKYKNKKNIKFIFSKDYCIEKDFKSFDLVFIDSAPWSSRYEILKKCRHKSKIIIIHDCDYFPDNKIFGKTLKPLISKYSRGSRDYSDIFKNYLEYFPKKFHARTGPPTLIGSNFIQVRDFIKQ